MPLFSVIIPVFNSETTIQMSLQSIFNQTIKDFEVIAVNDGSTDNSLIILEEFRLQYSNLIIINQKNSGSGIARNNGISNAKGEYIAFLDSDDYWSPDFFETVFEASDNKKADYIYIEMVKETLDGNLIAKTNVSKNKNLTKEQMICRQMTGKMPWGMSKVIRREILLKSKGKFMGFTVGEENIFSFEALKSSKNIAFTDKVIYHYIQNETGQHKRGGFDPWNPLVTNFKQYLLVHGEYEKYESTINSLALKAMSISLYRYSNSMPMVKACKELRRVVKAYSHDYDFNNINEDALEKSTISILSFARMNLFLVIYIASRIRAYKQREKR